MDFKKAFSHCALFTLLGGLSPIICANYTQETSDSWSTDKQFEYIVELALTEGGKTPARVYFEYEDSDTESENIEAGSALYFYGGMQFSSSVFPLRLTLGCFADSVRAHDGSVSFSRLPLELMPPALDLADVGFGGQDANDALDLVLMYEYTFDGIYPFDVRYTNILYDFDGEDLESSNLGLVAEMKL